MPALLLPRATGDENRGPGQIACMSVTAIAALVVVCLRVYVRRSFVQRLGLDDRTIILAMIFGLITLATDSVKVANGFGRHVDTLDQRQQWTIIRFSIIGTPTLIISQGLAKVSICFLLLRLLRDAKAPRRKIALHALIAFLAIYTFMTVVVLLAQCNPISKNWDKSKPGSCWNPAVLSNVGIVHGGFNTSKDFAYTQIPLYLWADLEQNLAIIAACIPTLRPLFRFFDHSKVQNSIGWTSKGELTMAEPQEPQSSEEITTGSNQTDQEIKPFNASKVQSDIPIEHWERLLLGKKMVGPDAPEDPAVRSPPDASQGLLADYVVDFQAFRVARETSIPSRPFK
ncbi:uncharacterized protein KY384_005113 [Bacidia gigantensis]|uniref:uncharacterized protein n=1 Tax=Bacidia gigantensis TaxID=2732470 RepID=UPI001D03FA9D|nr:uncharacterized protein KY384_005113 [Bacidia gigantensis]KAG8529633.1 hypothetical protein KY384_005113 [Bacidia gigantensis]